MPASVTSKRKSQCASSAWSYVNFKRVRQYCEAVQSFAKSQSDEYEMPSAASLHLTSSKHDGINWDERKLKPQLPSRSHV